MTPFSIYAFSYISNFLQFCRALYAYIRILLLAKTYERKNLTLADIFEQNVKKHPHKQCILFENQEWDFTQV